MYIYTIKATLSYRAGGRAGRGYPNQCFCQVKTRTQRTILHAVGECSFPLLMYSAFLFNLLYDAFECNFGALDLTMFPGGLPTLSCLCINSHLTVSTAKLFYFPSLHSTAIATGCSTVLNYKVVMCTNEKTDQECAAMCRGRLDKPVQLQSNNAFP